MPELQISKKFALCRSLKWDFELKYKPWDPEFALYEINASSEIIIYIWLFI